MLRLATAACLGLWALGIGPALAQSAWPPSTQRYALEAQLDEVHKRVRGKVQIDFRNTSSRPLEALLFHLYLNAFRDHESVFMRESGGVLRGTAYAGPGSITLESLRIDGEDALARGEPELIAGDRTQLRVPLTTPLAPGAAIHIESRFVAQLPPLFIRSGYAQDFFAVAQWFPKLAKLEPDGHFESFPYHGLGEFYADFADYALQLDTAADLEIAASGVLAHESRSGLRVVRRFEAPHVHDMVFIAARGFRLEQERVGHVLVRYLVPPGYEQVLGEHARVVRAGLEQFGRAFGAYPYPVLSVILPPRGASGASGMEYPTLIVSEGPWFPLRSWPTSSGAFVTAHELAHQWFYGLLASDEARYPVLDEGLAQWASIDLVRRMFGACEGLGALCFDRFEGERAFALHLARSTAPGLPAHAYTPAEYAASVYARAAIALESIRRAYGRERFERALARYTRDQRFGHPTPHDLERAFDGVYGAGFAAATLRPLLFDGQSSAVHLAQARTLAEGSGYVTRVRARRSGAVALPTWLALYAANGRELTRVRWPSESADLVVAVDTHEPVARAVLDPDRALLLDPNVADQVAHFASPSTLSPIARWLGVAQLVSSWVGP